MRQVRTVDNHETLRMTPIQRAADRLEFVCLIAEIFGQSGTYAPGLLREIREAEFVLRRLRNRKAK